MLSGGNILFENNEIRHRFKLIPIYFYIDCIKGQVQLQACPLPLDILDINSGTDVTIDGIIQPGE